MRIISYVIFHVSVVRLMIASASRLKLAHFFFTTFIVTFWRSVCLLVYCSRLSCHWLCQCAGILLAAPSGPIYISLIQVKVTLAASSLF